MAKLLDDLVDKPCPARGGQWHSGDPIPEP
jgi:hypothetical protein